MKSITKGRANPEGYATPFIFVTSPKTGKIVSEKISKFEYVYNEEADDICTIVFESVNLLLPDMPEFQEDAELNIIWGFRTGRNSNKRSIFIRDTKPEYSEDGLKFTVIATDKASYMRGNSTIGTENNVSPKDLIEKTTKKYGVKVEYQWSAGQQAGYDLSPGDNLPAENLPPVDQETGAIGTPLGKFFWEKQDSIVIPPSRSDYRAVVWDLTKEHAESKIAVARDDKLIIKDKDLAQAPSKVYRYKSDDEIIKFTPETKIKLRKKDGLLKISHPNRDGKEWVDDITVNEETDNQTRLAGMVFSSPDRVYTDSASGIQIDAQGKIIGTGRLVPGSRGTGRIEPVQEGVDVDNAFVFGEKSNSPGIINPMADATKPITLQGPEKTTSGPGFIIGGVWHSASDNLAEKFTPIASMQQATYKTLTDARAAQLTNAKEDASMDTYPGQFVAIGDPAIESGMIVNIQNVAKKFAGNYYIKELTHSLTGEGYLMTGTITRNAQGDTGDESATLTTTTKPVNTTNQEKTPKAEVVIKENSSTTPWWGRRWEIRLDPKNKPNDFTLIVATDDELKGIKDAWPDAQITLHKE